MVSSISSSAVSAQGVSNLLRSNAGSGLFDTLGGVGADTSADGLFAALGSGGATQSVDAILQKQRITSTKNAMYVDAATRIGYIQQGKLDPGSDWEKIIGYAMNKGIPAIAFIDDAGVMQAQLQTEADLSKYNPVQMRSLLESMDEIGIMAQKILANETNDGWLAKLAGASQDVYLVANYVLAPQDFTPNNWEQEAVNLTTNNKPVKISLDVKGELQAIDQLYDPSLADLPETLRAKLMAAIESIPTTIENGTVLELWEVDAQNFATSKIPYYLDIDPITEEISAKENSPDNITPDFLKTPPYPEIGDNTDLLKEVAQFVKDKKPYFLDIDSTGQVVAKETTAQSLIKFNTPKAAASTGGAGSILSLFA